MQFISEAMRLNLTIHSSWPVGEICQLIIDHKKNSGEASIEDSKASRTFEPKSS